MRKRVFFETRTTAVNQTNRDFIFRHSLAAASDSVLQPELLQQNAQRSTNGNSFPGPQGHRSTPTPESNTKSRDICHQGYEPALPIPGNCFDPQSCYGPGASATPEKNPICHYSPTLHQRIIPGKISIRAHCPANLCSFWGGAAGVPKSILARSEEKSTGKSKFVNSFQLFAPFGSALATRFPFQLFVPARQPGRISRLCRARHNRLYAEYRIMPRAAG